MKAPVLPRHTRAIRSKLPVAILSPKGLFKALTAGDGSELENGAQFEFCVTVIYKMIKIAHMDCLLFSGKVKHTLLVYLVLLDSIWPLHPAAARTHQAAMA